MFEERPRSSADWSLLGALIGERLNSYWRVAVIDGIEARPDASDLTALGAALATYGSSTIFHIVGVTPEAPDSRGPFDGPPHSGASFKISLCGVKSATAFCSHTFGSLFGTFSPSHRQIHSTCLALTRQPARLSSAVTFTQGSAR